MLIPLNIFSSQGQNRYKGRIPGGRREGLHMKIRGPTAAKNRGYRVPADLLAQNRVFKN